MGKENGDETIKEEVNEGDEEEMVEANPEGSNILPGGFKPVLLMSIRDSGKCWCGGRR